MALIRLRSLLRSQGRTIPLWHFLTGLTSMVVLGAFVLFAGYMAHEQSQIRLGEIQRDMRNIARSIAAGAINDLLAENLDNLELVLRQQVEIGTIRRIVLTDAQQHVLLQVNRQPHGPPSIDYPSMRIRLPTEPQEELTADYFRVITPIGLKERVGWVEITAGLDDLHAQKAHIWQDTIITSLLTSLFSAVLLLYVVRRLSHSLSHAAHFAAHLKEQRETQLPLSSRITELRQLQQALNMAGHELAEQYHQLDEAQARKSAVLEANLDCLITIDSKGRIVDLNPAAEQTFGYSREETLGVLMADLIIPPEFRQAHQKGMEHYLNTGYGPVLRKHIELTAMRKDGTLFPIELAIVPFIINNEPHFLGSIRDIGERKALQQEQERITELLQRAVSELKLRQQALDEHAIVSIADLNGEILFANDKLTEISGYSREELLGHTHRVLRSGVQDETFYDNLWQTIRSGQVWHGELANRRKDGSIYWVASTIVPMCDETGVPCQYISIHTDISSNKYNEQQLALYHQELAISRERELALGHQIQHTLLFGDIPTRHEGLSIAVYTQASMGVDGDFYDFFSYGNNYVDLSIADVMGKGVTAALIGAALKQRLNQVVASMMIGQEQHAGFPTPEQIINTLHERVAEKLIALDTFVTLFYLRLDLKQQQAIFVNAGHTRAILTRGSQIQLLNGDNLPLGVMPYERYQQHTLPLNRGDLLFLYSDGVTEARAEDGQEFGEKRLCQLVSSLVASQIPVSLLIEAVRKTVTDFAKPGEQSDDRTCIALQLEEKPQNHTLQLPWVLDQLTPMRELLASQLKQADWPATAIDQLLLAAHEIVTNIIRHNPKPLPDARIHCLLQLQPSLLSMQFYYLGTPFIPPESTPDFSGNSDGGFGLFIIDQYVDELSYTVPAPGICQISLSRTP